MTNSVLVLTKVKQCQASHVCLTSNKRGWRNRVMTAAPAAALSCSDFTSRTLSAGSAWATLQRKSWRRRLSAVITYQCLTKKKSTQILLWAVYSKSFKISQCSHHFPAGCLLLRSCGNLGPWPCLQETVSFKSPVTTRSLSIPQSFATASAAARWSPVHIHTSKSGSVLTTPLMKKTIKHWRGLEYSILVREVITHVKGTNKTSRKSLSLLPGNY